MWELICFHRYIWGAIAADRSSWHSDGVVSGVTALPGGGLKFSSPQSSVWIPRRPADAWDTLQALHVEIVASSLQGGGTVIDADGCFRVSFNGPQTLVVEILGHTLTAPLGDLPLGNWVNFQFTHNGVNQLSYDFSFTTPSGGGFGGDVPVTVPGPVPPVGPQGVWIGNRVNNASPHFNGNISSVKIWRLNPQAMITTFLGRPFTPPVLQCWTDLLSKLNEVIAQNPECAEWLQSVANRQYYQTINLLGQKSTAVLAEFNQMCKAYQQLWRAGKVGSPEMQALMVRMRDWLKDQQIFSSDDASWREILNTPCLAKIAGAVGSLDCDPDAQALLKAILGIDQQQAKA